MNLEEQKFILPQYLFILVVTDQCWVFFVFLSCLSAVIVFILRVYLQWRNSLPEITNCILFTIMANIPTLYSLSYYENSFLFWMSWIKIFVSILKSPNFIEDVYPVFVWTVILECYIWKFEERLQFGKMCVSWWIWQQH